MPMKYSGHRVFNFAWPGSYTRVYGINFTVSDSSSTVRTSTTATTRVCHAAIRKPTSGVTSMAFTVRAGSNTTAIIEARTADLKGHVVERRQRSIALCEVQDLKHAALVTIISIGFR